jgi:polyvinyl alcohol dehydrogenase (cytochrome)
VFFGDLNGTIYALDARSGALVWKDRPEAHPNAVLTAAPVLDGERLYVPVSSVEEVMTSSHYECCTFRGSLVAYEARTGRVVWRTYTTDRPKLQGINPAGAKKFGPSGAPIWNSPAIDQKRAQLYFGTGNNYSSPASATSNAIMALDLDNGRVKWIYQASVGDAFNTGCLYGQPLQCPKENGPDADFGAAAILATTSDGRDLVVAGQKSGFVYALDPDSGKLIWKSMVGRGGIAGGIEFGMAIRGDSVFVPINDTDDGKTYARAERPGLYALDLRNGTYLWQSPDSSETCRNISLCSSGIYSAITATPDFVLTGNNDGWLRIYDADGGRVLWHYDMTQSVTTVGGGKAKGGSMGGGAAPIAYHGMLIVPSGHGLVNAIPGNVLLAFDTN